MRLGKDSIMKTRLLTSGYYDSNPQYKYYTLANWPFIMPCASDHKDIKDTYHYYAWRPGNHKGIDILGKIGIPILSIGGGVVHSIDNPTDYELKQYPERYVYGRQIIIKHGFNMGFMLYSRYAHLNSINYLCKKTGVKVKKGQPVGAMGTTGDSLDPHLHFEILMHGFMLPPVKMRQVDPIPFLPRDEVVERLIEDATHGVRFEEGLK